MTTTAIARPILPPGPTPAPVARRRRLRTAQIVHRALLALILLIQVYPLYFALIVDPRHTECKNTVGFH